MALSDFIGADERIRLRFRSSLQYLSAKVVFVGVLTGGLAYFFRDNAFFFWLSIGCGVGLIFIFLHWYLTLIFFVTEKKVYRREGFLWRKVTSSLEDEIDDIRVNQSVIGRWIFNMGTIEFSSSGSTGYEIAFDNVADPFNRLRQIQTAWDIDGV